jgi:hypothetical protein
MVLDVEACRQVSRDVSYSRALEKPGKTVQFWLLNLPAAVLSTRRQGAQDVLMR